MSLTEQIRTKPKHWASACLVAAGLASGTVIGATMTTGASAGASPVVSATSSSTGSSSLSSSPPDQGGYQVPDKTGTVTAVGSKSVTIDGKIYAVTSGSDIDKNGEAALSNLAVGDKVTFNTDSSVSTPTIDKLHAGSEALDRPAGHPGDFDSSSSGASTGSSTSGSTSG